MRWVYLYAYLICWSGYDIGYEGKKVLEKTQMNHAENLI